MDAFLKLFYAGTLVFTLSQAPDIMPQDNGKETPYQQFEKNTRMMTLDCDGEKIMLSKTDEAGVKTSNIGMNASGIVVIGSYVDKIGFLLTEMTMGKDSTLQMVLLGGKNGVLDSYDTADFKSRVAAENEYGSAIFMLTYYTNKMMTECKSLKMEKQNGMTEKEADEIYSIFYKETKACSKIIERVLKEKEKPKSGNGQSIRGNGQNYRDALRVAEKAINAVKRNAPARQEKRVFRIMNRLQ